MSLSTDELLQIQNLPDFLRTEHCYNDLQHGMLVILFRHALSALRSNRHKIAGRMIDNISLYLYIHFLNEEEGLAYKLTEGLLERETLQEHSEQHIRFLDFWRDEVLLPYKNKDVQNEQTIEKLSKFYNLIIKHIDDEDIPAYGEEAITVQQTRAELARLAQTNMPMSPFMAGAFAAVKHLDSAVANALDMKHISPRAMQPMAALDLVQNVGRILPGTPGSLGIVGGQWGHPDHQHASQFADVDAHLQRGGSNQKVEIPIFEI